MIFAKIGQKEGKFILRSDVFVLLVVDLRFFCQMAHRIQQGTRQRPEKLYIYWHFSNADTLSFLFDCMIVANDSFVHQCRHRRLLAHKINHILFVE